jgi:hypothetical protein
MSRTLRVLTSASALVLFVACTADDVMSPEPAPDAVRVQMTAATASVDGDWNFSRVVQITAPDWVAIQIFGVPPEGEITHIRCESTGTLVLDQDGFQVTGFGEFTATCTTGNGVVFPGGADIAIVDGRIRGRALRFTLVEDGMLACPYSGVIVEDEAGTATRLRGTGRCVVPGHPQSPVPLDPPPAGTSKTLIWEAWRS